VYSCESDPSNKPVGPNRIVIENDSISNAAIMKSPISKFKKDDLVGVWVSQSEIRNGVKSELKNIHRLELSANGKFNSYYKPSNHKTGNWELRNDSILQLYMKAVDLYRLLQLTDTSLSCQLLFNYPDTVVINYQKIIN